MVEKKIMPSTEQNSRCLLYGNTTASATKKLTKSKSYRYGGGGQAKKKTFSCCHSSHVVTFYTGLIETHKKYFSTILFISGEKNNQIKSILGTIATFMDLFFSSKEHFGILNKFVL